MLGRKSYTYSAVVALAWAALMLGGCIKVEVLDRSEAAVHAIPTAEQQRPAEHDLSVLAVDFDPPLQYAEVVNRRSQGQGITLLVAVENTGLSTEQNVTVEVSLTKDSDETVVLNREGKIGAIVPGEIKVIRFEDTDIPFSHTYQLCVSVAPAAGEVRLGDNQRNYDLLITQP